MRRTAAVAMLALAALVVGAAASAPGSAGATAPHATEAVIGEATVVVGGYQMFADVSADGAGADDQPEVRVAAVLTGPTGVLKSRAEAERGSDGTTELSFVRRGPGRPAPVLVEPGDELQTVVDGVPSEPATVPRLSSVADAETDVISGTAPAGSRLTLVATSPGGGLGSGVAEADADGRWVADFSDTLDLVPGSRGVAVLRSASVMVYQSEWLVRDVQVRIGDNVLEVPARSGQTVTATVVDELGTEAGRARAVAWSDAAHLWLRDADGTASPILQGNTVRLELTSGVVISLQVPTLEAHLDAESDALRGLAPPGDDVLIDLHAEIHHAVADAAGQWELDLAGTYDVSDDTIATVRAASAEWCSLTSRTARLVTVDPFDAGVDVQGPAGEAVELQLVRAGAEPGWPGVKSNLGPDGTARLLVPDEHGDAIALEADDRLAGHLGPVAFEFASPPVVAYADTSLPAVTGRATAGSAVTVDFGGGSWQAAADGDGLWIVDLPPDTSMAPGDEVGLHIEGPNGYRLEFAFPVLQATVDPNSSIVGAAGGPGLEVTFHVTGPSRERPIARGSCVIRRRECVTSVRDAFDEYVAVAPGDRVVVRPTAGLTSELQVSALTAHIDLPGKSVTGEGPPGETVRIGFRREDDDPCPVDTSATVFGSGVYDYELRGSEQELLAPGLAAKVTATIESGHRLRAFGVFEVAHANTGPVVWGLAEPRAALRAELRDPGGALVTAVEGVARDDASIWLDLRNGTDVPEARQPLVRTGDTVTLAHARGLHSVAIVPVAGVVDAATGAVTGLTVPNTPLRTRYYVGTAPEGSEVLTVRGESDDSGLFYVEAPPIDVDPEALQPLVDVYVTPDGVFSTSITELNRLRYLYVPVANAGP